MGSLGAGKVNDGLLKSMNLFKKKDYEVLFITGREHYEKVKDLEFPSNVKLLPYLDNLPGAMKIADVIVSRAGATSLSEITALLKPSILIPSPYVANNEQYYNAADLIEHNCAVMIEEKNFTGEVLVNRIDEIINNPRLIANMQNNLKKISIPDSATRIYKEIRSLIDRK
jgi:UDP-N-acetylglucosamine--N-acetylmuramyl-(pentapeptide) pyrophosphoryl-undecaprenol N-acetylglucosamine transferase